MQTDLPAELVALALSKSKYRRMTMKRRGFVSVLPTAIGMSIVAPAAPSSQKAPSGIGYSQDQVDVAQVVVGKFCARDMAQWDAMQAAFHPGAMVDISWFNGLATEYISRSKHMFQLGGRGLHLIGPVLVKVRGDRATADAGAQITARVNIKGVECLTQAYARIIERLERRDGKWGIVLFQAIYQMDTIAAANPGQRLDLDQEKLASYRSSYRFLSYVLGEYGIKVRPDLPGIDRPDSVEAVYRINGSWLKGEGSKS